MAPTQIDLSRARQTMARLHRHSPVALARGTLALAHRLLKEEPPRISGGTAAYAINGSLARNLLLVSLVEHDLADPTAFSLLRPIRDIDLVILDPAFRERVAQTHIDETTDFMPELHGAELSPDEHPLLKYLTPAGCPIIDRTTKSAETMLLTVCSTVFPVVTPNTLLSRFAAHMYLGEAGDPEYVLAELAVRLFIAIQKEGYEKAVQATAAYVHSREEPFPPPSSVPIPRDILRFLADVALPKRPVVSP